MKHKCSHECKHRGRGTYCDYYGKNLVQLHLECSHFTEREVAWPEDDVDEEAEAMTVEMSGTPMPTHFDIDGRPTTLISLCRKDPEWAARRIRVLVETGERNVEIIKNMREQIQAVERWLDQRFAETTHGND